MEQLISLIPSLFLGLALSAGSGFRVFIPLLISNLATKTGAISVNADFAFMSSNTATFVLIIAVLAEVGSYYISYIDNLLDTIAVPSAVIAGTLLTTQFLQIDDPVIKWGLGLIAGGGIAGTVQAGTGIIRLASTKFTGGLGNSFFSTLENITSFLVSLFAIWLPVFMGFLVLISVYHLLRKLLKKPVS